jgi:hypothetical protein
LRHDTAEHGDVMSASIEHSSLSDDRGSTVRSGDALRSQTHSGGVGGAFVGIVVLPTSTAIASDAKTTIDKKKDFIVDLSLF